MQLSSILSTFVPALLLCLTGCATGQAYADALPIIQFPLNPHLSSHESKTENVSLPLFMELEELARLVDISYCAGVVGGIRKPFECLSRCDDFPGFELLTQWNTGPLFSDSAGYIALDHNAAPKGRIIVAFRGTYSLAGMIVDLTTVPQEYVPYPGDPDEGDGEDGGGDEKTEKRHPRWWEWVHGNLTTPASGYERQSCEEVAKWDHVRIKHLDCAVSKDQQEHCRYLADDSADGYDAEAAERKAARWAGREDKREPECRNRTVHMGFLRSWQNTRKIVLAQLIFAKRRYPDYTVHLVGHSLGGAVAALAGLELKMKGYDPVVTTFGEPKIGNEQLRDYLDMVFGLGTPRERQRYRRVTHIMDPVPLLPLTEWGYRMHAGEVYIGRRHLPPVPEDLRMCKGDEDTECSAGQEQDLNTAVEKQTLYREDWEGDSGWDNKNEMSRDEWRIMGGMLSNEGWREPSRYKMRQLFYAHREYFVRLGLCMPGGDWGGLESGIGGVQQMIDNPCRFGITPQICF